MPRPIHFEIHAPDPEREMAFYRKTFGWTFTKWEGSSVDFWLVKTGEGGPGIDGGLMRSKDGQARTINTLDVPDLDGALRSSLANGATLALPKMPVPGVGWLAYCMDTGGNIFGMMQADPDAR